MKLFLKGFIVLAMTLLTQIGGILYLITELVFRKRSKNDRLKKTGFFLVLYLVFTFFIIPVIAPLFGREKIKDTDQIAAHTFFTKLCNRNYVTPELHYSLRNIVEKLQKTNPEIMLVYLDANFPFINGFPLPPHLSHNDGKKIDLSFVYSDKKGSLVNKKPAILGYGAYTSPIASEYNQIQQCKGIGYWQYDITKYITLGITNNHLKFSEKATKDLLLAIVKQPEIRKVFIEPHLKQRLGMNHQKIRFHGCQAVRHDDHIHIQL